MTPRKEERKRERGREGEGRRREGGKNEGREDIFKSRKESKDKGEMEIASVGH